MNTAGIIAFICGIICGTGSTVTIKLVYGMSSVGIDGEERVFEKPLTTTFVMFFAMSLALPVHLLIQYFFVEQDKRDIPSFKLCLWMFIPSIFDLVGTALGKVALMYIDVSLFQVLRSLVIVLVAFLKVSVLKHHLAGYQWMGVTIIATAMLLASATAFIHPDVKDESTRDPRIGLLFVLGSVLVQGSQYVFEESVMSQSEGKDEDEEPEEVASPLVVVGCEGMWGSLLMILVVWPWAYILPGNDVGGSMENVYDSWVMMQNSTGCTLMLLAFFVTVGGYNFSAIWITASMSSVWHAILDAIRPCSVWLLDLAIFYWFTDGSFGEAWVGASWLQLAGLFVLLYGTAVYNGNIRMQRFEHEYDEDDVDTDAPVPRVLDGALSPRMQSGAGGDPTQVRSPLMRRRVKRTNSGGGGGGGGGGFAGYGSVSQAEGRPVSYSPGHLQNL